MSTNVTKLSKNQSQPHSSTPTIVSQNHSLQLQHHPSLEANKDKEPMPNIKDIQPHTTTAISSTKKLTFLIDPHKDLYNSVSPTHSTHTSPKSFLGSPIKSNKVKVSGSSLDNSGVNLISPKDLVRLAMSKHKPKATVKKVTVQAATSVPKNMRKSLSLRFAPGVVRPDKHEGSISKLTSNSIIEDTSSVSKTSVPNYQDKSAKLKRMKLIYSDIAQSEANRLSKSTVYTPHEVSGRMWQGTLSPNRSNSGLLWPGSPNGTLNTSIKNQFFVNQTGFGVSDKQFFGKSSEEDSKEEKSYSKRASVEQIGSYLKEAKPLVKQRKRQEKKNAQTRAMTSMDNIKVTSASFSRVMSNHTVNQELVERAKSPVEGVQSVDENEMDETIEILNANEQGKMKEVKPREEFIADLKNWVNDIVKPQDENQILAAPSKNSAAAEKVKEAQEGLLEKLRGALENDEFVRREDYERLYRERDSIEDELDAVKEENAQLRVLLWRMQEDNEARDLREMEEKKATAAAISNYDQQVQEAMTKQYLELERLRKRENVVKDLLKMVWKAGIQIGDLQEEDMKENVDFDEEQYYQQQQQMEQMQLIHNMQHGENPYSNSYYTKAAKQDLIKQKYEHLQPIGEDDSYQNGITEQKEEFESGSSSRNLIALSEMGDSESAFSTRQQQAEMMANMNPQGGLASTVLKETSNSNNPNDLKSKTTADSLSAKLTPQSCFPARAQGNMKLDLTGLGGNQVPNTLAFLSQSSTEKIGHYVGTNTNTVQSLGFHEEFMSKLEEFSLSWRQDALNYQKF